MLASGPWRKVSWRRGTKGRLSCLFAARRVRIADGHRHRMLDNRVQAMPGDEVWLVGERRSNGEQKYYVSNLAPDTSLKVLAATIKARWVCEQAHQQLKEELGLDHFEGRSWKGLHRHALMSMIAYAFLQSRRLAAAGRKKKESERRPPQPSMPAIRQAILDLFARPPPLRCAHCEKLLAEPTTDSAKVVLGARLRYELAVDAITCGPVRAPSFRFRRSRCGVATLTQKRENSPGWGVELEGGEEDARVWKSALKPEFDPWVEGAESGAFDDYSAE